jgi:hypothetical protein
MVQMQFQIKEEVMDALKAEAAKMGITPNIFARLVMHKHFSPPDAEVKTYTFATRSWRELEAYIKVRNLGSVESFAPVAMDIAMSRNRLSARQKAEFERILKN